MISQGSFLGQAGGCEEAIRQLRKGLALVDWKHDPRLVLWARHNLAWFLNDIFGTVNSSPWIGFIIVFGLLLIVAAIAGLVGVRWIKRGVSQRRER